MSLIGKGSSSIRKKDVMEQKSIALGFKKMMFAHKATSGDTSINLSSLVTPTEMSTNGFVNPSAAALARVNINQFRNNLKLMSSLSGMLMPHVTYNVTSSNQIIFNNFTAADGEIFVGWLDEAPTTSLSVVDGQPIITSGTLTAGSTDFNIGTPIEINKYPSKNHGAVLVFVDRALQYRKVGNVTGGDGDYIEVPVAGGLGSLIRFDASGADRYITVISNGIVAERPDGSMTAMIERVQGQVDQMVPTLAALAGVPETTFQTAPNDVDLKQFGDTVIENDTILQDVLDQSLLTVKTCYVKYVTTSGNAGPAASNGSYGTTAFNTFEGDGSIANLSSNQITLQPGTYKIRATVPYYYSPGATTIVTCKIKLRNITDSTDTIIGMSHTAAKDTAGYTNVGLATLTGIFTITGSKIFEIQNRSAAGVLLGAPATFGDSEVYSTAEIVQLASPTIRSNLGL